MTDLPEYLSSHPDGVRLRVFVQPKAAKTELVGIHGPALKLKVRAVPERGRANEAVCKLVAELLGVPTSNVEVVAGGSTRFKTVVVAGVGIDRALGAIGAHLKGR